MRDLKFLLDIQVMSSREIEDIAKEVLFILRHNRKKATLPLEQVEVGNSFILAAHRLSCVDPSIALEISLEDLTYISTENDLLHMGPSRN